MSRPLERRTLRLRDDLAGFEYCAKVRKTFFHPWVRKCDVYMFADVEAMKLLHAKDFVLKVREKP